MQPVPARFNSLPLDISTSKMKLYAVPGETLIRCELRGTGNQGVHRIRGRVAREYIFEWDHKRLVHCLRVPSSLWHLEKGAMATDLLDVPGNTSAYRIVVLADEKAPEPNALPEPPTPPQLEPPPQLPIAPPPLMPVPAGQVPTASRKPQQKPKPQLAPL